MYRMRLSTFRMKTCAALKGAVESTVPDTLAVPGRAAPCAAGVAAADPLAPKTTNAIARLPINAMINRDDLDNFHLRMICLLEIVSCCTALFTETGSANNII